MGTDDDVIVASDDPDCNDVRFARHDGQVWRCWTNVVTDTSIDSCVSDDKTMVKCGTRGTGGRCTRNEEILKLIHYYTGKETDSFTDGEHSVQQRDVIFFTLYA